jgi:2-dehydropantoate 2-reductase
VRIVIVGAGAIGGYIGARLCAAGANVALVARGPHLRAMQERGLSVRSPAGDVTVRPEATDDLASLGPADVVMLGVKAPSLTSIAPRLAPLLGPDTAVVSMQNGLPWWYFQQHDASLEGLRIERVDPGGIVAGAIEQRRVVGSIAYFSAEVEAPGVIRHTEGNRISFGEPDGTRSDRARRIAEALIAVGFRCPVTTRIRHEIWVKLLGNVAFNPVSVLTGATLEQLARDPETARLVRQVMTEVEGIARSLGLTLPVSVEQRFSGAGSVGAHKTSMLQDYEAGRPTELESVVGAVVELADKLGMAIPATQAVYACARMLEARKDPPQGPRHRARPESGTG